MNPRNRQHQHPRILTARHDYRFMVFLLLACLVSAFPALAQVANGKLQIHFMDVGQGDGAVLISPGGEAVLFDDGVQNNCDKPISYLQQLGVTRIAYQITSHYHSDHIGCAAKIFEDIVVPSKVLDRGRSYPSSTFKQYASESGSHRQTAVAGEEILLDHTSPNPVRIRIVALNGNGIATDNENDLSLVAVVTYGGFRAEIGGDLSGYHTDNYEDIETSVAPLVGPINVYKVHHHCSRYSTNEAWLAATKPQIAIVSTGDGNRYGHPTLDCLERLHKAGVKAYWTERGEGADPDPGFDTVSGNIVVEVGSDSYTVTHNGNQHDTYTFGNSAGAIPPTGTAEPAAPVQQYAWSKKSKVYHYANCRFVSNISPENLETGSAPPPGKILHKNCPR